MAVTFRLENQNASTTFTFDGTDVKQLVGTRFWTPAGDRVTETWRISKNDTAANIRTSITSLEDLLRDMHEWQTDLLENDSIWVRWASDGETAKRALLYSFQLVPVEHGTISMGMDGVAHAYFDIAITRHFAWEDVSASSNQITSTKDWIGAQYDQSGTLSGGRLPGRVERLRISNGSGFVISKAWIGCRPKRYGTTFTTLFESENGSTGTDTGLVTDNTAGGASPSAGANNALQCTFATDSTMAQRCEYAFTTPAITNHQAGHYHVLLRCRVTDSTLQVGIRLTVGFASFQADEPHIQFATQYITGTDTPGTSYQLVPMGTAMLPPTGLRYALQNFGPPMTNLWDSLRFTWHAEKLSGSGNLNFDSFILIPAEHSIYLENMELSSSEVLNVLTNEDGTLEAYVTNSAESLLQSFPVVSDTGINPWGYPRDGGIFVLAGMRDIESDVDADMTYLDVEALYKRWLIYHD
jgi:hypothetical protein